MSAHFEQLPLQPGDTLSSLRVKLAGLRGQRVLLIWSAECDMLKRKLDLVLVQREADRKAIQLALVATDPRLIGHAKALNISCFDSVEAAHGARWLRSRQKVFLPRAHRTRPALQPSDLAYIAAQLQRRRRGPPWWSRLAQALGLLLLMGFVGALILIAAPSAVIEVNLRLDSVSATVDIVADSKIEMVDAQRARIPAQRLLETVETTAAVLASGRQWLDSAAAAKLVAFTNLTADPVRIPRGSAISVSDDAPGLYETTGEVVVPAGIGASVYATVAASGETDTGIGIVGAATLADGSDLAARVSVAGLASAGGGNPSVPMVTEADHSRLRDAARIQLQSLAYDRLRADLSDSRVIVLESLQIAREDKDWLDYSAEIGALTSRASLTMRAEVSALALDEALARQVLLARLQAAAPADMRLLPDTMHVQRGAFSLSRAQEQVRFTAQASAKMTARLHGDALRAQLAGASLDEALALLAGHPAIAPSPPPRLSLHPPGLGHMPLLPLRIFIEVQDAA